MNTNINLERDPQYNEAKQKLTNLKLELTELEKERDSHVRQLNESTINKPHKSKLDAQANALLSNADSSIHIDADFIRKTYEALTEKISVHRRAIELQNAHLNKLKFEISKEISKEILPEHIKNVRAIVKAALELEITLSAEAALRDDLYVNDVSYSSHIRPMPIVGLGMLRDSQSQIGRYLLECYEHGFITKKELPECLHGHIPARIKPSKQEPKPILKVGDWLSIN